MYLTGDQSITVLINSDADCFPLMRHTRGAAEGCIRVIISAACVVELLCLAAWQHNYYNNNEPFISQPAALFAQSVFLKIHYGGH